jgi:cephalosporin hydroxylase
MYDPYECVGIHLFGLPMSQTFADVLLWERLLNAHPSRSLVEIGTGEGGFSRYLAMQAGYRGMEFTTFDVVQPMNGEVDALVPGFILGDVFENPELVRDAVRLQPSILFCDGGNKAREMQTFAPLLTPGDLLVVHDWGSEVGHDDVPTTYLERAHEDWCFELRSMSRAFTRLPDLPPDPDPGPETENDP